MSSLALSAPADLLSDLLALSASVRAAWTRPAKTSPADIAEEIRVTLRILEAATGSLIGLEGRVRTNLAKIRSLTDDADVVARETVTTFIGDVDTMLASVPTEVPEGDPFERLLKNVVEPYNDAVRTYRRALRDYHGGLCGLLAAIDARNAVDARIASSAMADDTDAVVPWGAARDNVRKIR